MGPHSSGLGPHVPLPEYIENMRKIATHLQVRSSFFKHNLKSYNEFFNFFINEHISASRYMIISQFYTSCKETDYSRVNKNKLNNRLIHCFNLIYMSFTPISQNVCIFPRNVLKYTSCYLIIRTSNNKNTFKHYMLTQHDLL